MINIENVKVRANKDGTKEKLLGWAECLIVVDKAFRYYLNNIKVKKVELDGGFKLALEYPHKIVTKEGIDEKKYYFKPVSKEAYSIIETEVIKKVREAIYGCNTNSNISFTCLVMVHQEVSTNTAERDLSEMRVGGSGNNEVLQTLHDRVPKVPKGKRKRVVNV